MPSDQEPRQLDHGASRYSSLLTRILAVAAGVIVLIGAVAISFVLFAVALTAIVMFGIYVWWKTRHLRKELRDRAPPEGTVIEGQVNWRKDVDNDPRA